MAVNLFASPLAGRWLSEVPEFGATTVELLGRVMEATETTGGMLRKAAVSLGINLAGVVGGMRGSGEMEVDEGLQVELVACLLKGLEKERDKGEVEIESARMLLLAVGLMGYGCLAEGEVRDLMKVLEAEETVKGFERWEELRGIVGEVRQVVS